MIELLQAFLDKFTTNQMFILLVLVCIIVILALLVLLYFVINLPKIVKWKCFKMEIK